MSGGGGGGEFFFFFHFLFFFNAADALSRFSPSHSLVSLLSLSPTLPPLLPIPQVYDTYVLSDPIGWAKGWGSLAADVAADPVMKNRVMFGAKKESFLFSFPNNFVFFSVFLRFFSQLQNFK